MDILRAKTKELFLYDGYTEKQKQNKALNLKEIEEKRVKLGSYPRRLVLELTNACNLKCIMCGRNESVFNNRFLDMSYLYNNIADVLEYVEEVTLFGWGEPTIHPEFGKIVEFLDKYPVHKYFLTNGSTLRKISDYLFDFKVDIMAISLDGATAETNNRIRLGSDFDRIVADLKDIVQQRRVRNVSYPYVNFALTLMKQNLHELPDMVNLAHEIGIEEVKAVYLTTFSEKLEEEVLWNKADEVKEVFAEAVEWGRARGIKVKLPHIQGEDIAGTKFHKDCFVGWRDFFIGSDGNIRPCQSISRNMFHISKYRTLMEAWNSEEMMHFRSVVNEQKKMWDECKRCYQSSHANWNRKTSFLQIDEEFAPQWERRHQ
ncbi:MAG: radical SAM protein [Nitrospirae bacterium]|nr:radical SAM protein [Nitrospirota bacterium]